MALRDIETRTLDEIRLFQEQELKKTLRYLNTYSRFYNNSFKKHKIDPGKINTLDDLVQLPLTTKEDLQLHGSEFVCVDKSQIVDYITTSGTLGEPVVFAMTDNDLNRLAYNELLGFSIADCNNEDIFQLMTTIDRRFMAGLAYFLGARMLKAAMVRVGNGIPELQWDSIKRFSPTTLVAVPSFLLSIIDYAEKHGIDHHACGVKRAVCIGDSIRNTDFTYNTLGKKISEKWPGLKLYSTYASTEMATSFTECEFGVGGHHNPDLIIVEFLDEHDKPVHAGIPGEVTITTLGVEGMPLLRFKTGDIATAHEEPCKCGRNTMRMGPVIGRKKQMIKFKGTTLYPPALYDILENIDGVKNYVVEVYTNNIGTDEILIRIGATDHSESFEKIIKDHFRARLRVAPSISFESPDYISSLQFPPMSRKPVKLIDRRGK
ncbi:MAG TPA: AMP-binding protein [Bacteroidales bacterium]|nr:AMP-binding protein [Bacteroidales bacterium]